MKPDNGPPNDPCTPDDGLTTMSASGLARAQINDVVYAKRVSAAEGEGYAVYAANGTFLDIVESLAEVILTAHEHDMEVATVH